MSEQAVALAKLIALETLKKCFEFRVVEHEIKARPALWTLGQVTFSTWRL